MMPRYIDAELVKKELNRGNANIGLFNYLIAVIESTPAADVEEVRHGRWQKEPTDFSLCGTAYYSCSLCGFEEQIRTNYCPRCGAKMDGGAGA